MLNSVPIQYYNYRPGDNMKFQFKIPLFSISMGIYQQIPN